MESNNGSTQFLTSQGKPTLDDRQSNKRRRFLNSISPNLASVNNVLQSSLKQQHNTFTSYANCDALSLEIIGSKKYTGKIGARFMYGSKQIWWEIGECDSKQLKIEVEWDNITRMKASFVENQYDFLEIEVTQSRKFIYQKNGEKYTTLVRSDQAGYERHCITFHPEVLRGPYFYMAKFDSRISQFIHNSLPGPLSHLINPKPSYVFKNSQFREDLGEYLPEELAK